MRNVFSRSVRALKATLFGHDIKPYRVGYSQTGEDQVLASLFDRKRSGIYVEIGAFEPIKHSNTYSFYLAGWNGLLVEPLLGKTELFRRFRPRDEFVQCAVGTCEGPIDFEECEEYSRRAERADASTVRVSSRRLDSIFAESRMIADAEQIDFLSIDCEGDDLDVLQSNDWQRFRPRCVVVEEQPLFDDGVCGVFLQEKGYRLVGQTLRSSIFILPEFWRNAL